MRAEIAEKHQEYLSKLKIEEEKLNKIIDEEKKAETA